jgi:hypothetical protein
VKPVSISKNAEVFNVGALSINEIEVLASALKDFVPEPAESGCAVILLRKLRNVLERINPEV